MEIADPTPPISYTQLRKIDLWPEVTGRGWLRELIDISPYAGKDVLLRFRVANGDTAHASVALIDFVEWAEAPAVTRPISPATGGQLDYYRPGGRLTTQIQVPAGAVSKTTSVWYRPAAGPGYPLNGAAPLGAGAPITYAGIAFDLDAFDEFVYLPLVTQGSSGQGNGQSVFGLKADSPQAPAATTSFFFNTPISITIHYDDADLPPGVTEDQLYLYYWDPGTQMWQDAATSCNPALPYARDPLNNSFTVQVCHFSRFSVVIP